MTIPLWRGDELAALFDQADYSTDVDGVSIDTRTLNPGDLFIALSGDPGPRFGGGDASARDGHDFIAQAIDAGAAAVMVHKDIEVDVPMIRVGDTLDGLWQLGAAARTRFQGKVIALTGSSGKTTLRSWFEHVLKQVGSCHASTGSLNNHWGVPLSLSRMPADRDYGVLEVGTNSPGEIKPLSELVWPDVSMLLNVLPAHIGNFENMDALTEEKLSIAAGLHEGGRMVLPERLKSRSHWPATVTFGSDGADVSATAEADTTGTHLSINVLGRTHRAFMPFHGPERIESATALIAALDTLGADLEAALPALTGLPLPEGRGNLHEIGGVVVVDDSYNANPGSMTMSLNSFATLRASRKFAFLGEMLELGDDGDRYHREVARDTAGLFHIFSFGEGFEGCEFASPERHYHSVAEFDLQSFVAELQPGDAILVKGSNKVFWLNAFVKHLREALENRQSSSSRSSS